MNERMMADNWTTNLARLPMCGWPQTKREENFYLLCTPAHIPNNTPGRHPTPLLPNRIPTYDSQDLVGQSTLMWPVLGQPGPPDCSPGPLPSVITEAKTPAQVPRPSNRPLLSEDPTPALLSLPVSRPRAVPSAHPPLSCRGDLQTPIKVLLPLRM